MKADNREKIKEISAKKRQDFFTKLGGTKEEKDKGDKNVTGDKNLKRRREHEP